ncbi:MAG: hypothetical protein VCD00_19345 [Candidatus Hydrogenedentota bacterium]
MRKSAFLFTSFYAVVLFILLLKPGLFIQALESMSWRWIMLEEAIRGGFAVSLFGAASTSRMPVFLRVIGVLTIAEGFCYVIIGSEGLLAINDAMIGENIALFRAAIVGTLMLMGVIAFGLMSPREDEAVPQGIPQ